MHASSRDAVLLGLGLLSAVAAAWQVTRQVPEFELLLAPVADGLPNLTRWFFSAYLWSWGLPVAVVALWSLPALRRHRGVVAIATGVVGAVLLLLLFRWAMDLPLQLLDAMPDGPTRR